MTPDKHLPPFVTFTTGAALLTELGLVESITPDGLRYIARTDPDWAFGDGPNQMPYVMAGNAKTMETGKFLAMFEDGPRRGGRGRKPAPGPS
ncbi:hypothetical protein ADL35_39000 [Streptomyces sp. NRRL WC-3753]|nr:hypothetical protein ADL35_39000 [Streptomyces sp. NRRL WC-3753]